MKKLKYATLVYQAGIANVFRHGVALENRARLLQADFRACENFARGLQSAGIKLRSAWCNKAGDIINEAWQFDDFQAAPFSESFRPVN